MHTRLRLCRCCEWLPSQIASVEDYGSLVADIVEKPVEYHGRRVNVVGDYITCADMAEQLSTALGVKVRNCRHASCRA